VRRHAPTDLAPWNEAKSNVSEFGMDALRKGQGHNYLIKAAKRNCLVREGVWDTGSIPAHPGTVDW